MTTRIGPIRFASEFPKPRLCVRRLDATCHAEFTSAKARRDKKWIATWEHGGTVANAYNYPAATEVVIIVSDPNGLTVVWCGRASAKHISGCSACSDVGLFGAYDLFDKRVKRESRINAAWDFLKREHAQLWSPLEKLAYSGG